MRQPILYAFGLIFLLIKFGYAQDHQLSGTLTDQENKALSFVNVLLLRAADSTMIKGVSTMDDGSFVFAEVAVGDYLIKSSYVGYKTDIRPVKVNGDTSVPPIALQPAMEDLQGITVSFRKPSIEKKPDRLVFNVANTTLSSLSGYEIIKRTPGVIVVNNRIQVKNSEPVIYLNDKRVYLSDNELTSLLDGYSGANVEAVEVITNPPARYDAEGSVVLNIVTRNNVSIGYKGGLELKGIYAVFPKYNFNTQHYYKTKGVDFFFNYNYNRSKLNKNEDSFVNFTDTGSGEEAWETDFNKITREYTHSVNSILDITTGERSALTLSANLYFAPDKLLENSARTDIDFLASGVSNFFTTQSELENDTYNYVFGADYAVQFGDQGASWNTSVNYIYFQQDQFQDLNTNFFGDTGTPTGMNNFLTDGDQKNNIFTLQSDLSAGAGEGEFNTGLKYAKIESASRIDFTGTSLPSGAVNDNFEYDESIYAAYLEYNLSGEKWNWQLGLRAEYTDVMGNSIALGEVNTQEYFGLFPTLGLQYSPGDNHQYGLSYSRKVTRPRYQSLNPFRYFIIENQYKEGNPGLTRAISDKIMLSYTFNRRYTLELYYENIDDALITLPFQQNETRTSYDTQYNIDYSRQYSLDFTAPISLSPRLFTYVYTSAFYLEDRFNAVESGNVLVTNNTAGFFAQVYNGITLDQEGKMNLEVSYNYLSDFIVGSYSYKNQHTLNLSLRKNLWDDRGALTLGVDDVFNTTNVPLRSNYLNQDNGFFTRPETRKVFVAFRYNFGNFRLQDNERNTNPVELERLKEEEPF